MRKIPNQRGMVEAPDWEKVPPDMTFPRAMTVLGMPNAWLRNCALPLSISSILQCAQKGLRLASHSLRFTLACQGPNPVVVSQHGCHPACARGNFAHMCANIQRGTWWPMHTNRIPTILIHTEAGKLIHLCMFIQTRTHRRTQMLRCAQKHTGTKPGTDTS